MDLRSLDQRSFERSIQRYVEAIYSRPICSSVLRYGKAIAESRLKELVTLREVAFQEELCELDLETARLRSKLIEIDAELAARADAERVDPVAQNEDRNSAPPLANSQVIDHRLLLDRVLERRMQNGERKTWALAAWLQEHRGLCRTQVTDYRAGRITGRVSATKRAAIEAAILASAEKLGLKPRTNSD
jgi:hypothetical protein